MNPVDFSPNSPGRMVPIAEGWAFLPNPLPPPLRVDASLVQAVESARAAVGELNGIARLTDIDLVTGILARREAVSSSRIEGTQTEIIEVFEHEALEGKALPEDSDLFEVLNYRSTLDLAIAWLDEGRSFGLPLVRDLHARLLQGVRGANREPGRFRQRNVYIGRPDSGFDGARFVPAPYEHIDAGMDALMEFMAGTPSFGPMDKESTKDLSPRNEQLLMELANAAWTEIPPDEPLDPTVDYDEVFVVVSGDDTFYLQGYGPIRRPLAAKATVNAALMPPRESDPEIVRIAPLTIRVRSCAAVRLLLADSASAASPATSGVAMLVPLRLV